MEYADTDLVCKRCGLCCYYLIPDKTGKLRLKKCKHLRRNFKLGTTICREYNKRKQLRTQNGLVIDSYKDSEGVSHEIWCLWRVNSKLNYKGCPFNINGYVDWVDYCKGKGAEIEYANRWYKQG